MDDESSAVEKCLQRLGSGPFVPSRAGSVVTLTPRDASDATRVQALCLAERAAIRDALDQCGAVLIRGSDVATPQAYEALMIEGLGFNPIYGKLSPDWVRRLAVTARAPRGHGQVYNLPKPDAEMQGPHIEHGWRSRRPRYVSFWVEEAPVVAGETSLFSMSSCYEQLDSDVKACFDAYPSVYPAFGEEYPVHSVLNHPRTGKPCTVLWYFSDPLAAFAVEAYKKTPHHAANPIKEAIPWRSIGNGDVPVTSPDQVLSHEFQRDGSRVALSDEQKSRLMDQLYRSVQFVTWQKGDLLVIDNIALAHGRMPSMPPRTILVGYWDHEDVRAYAANKTIEVPAQSGPYSSMGSTSRLVVMPT